MKRKPFIYLASAVLLAIAGFSYAKDNSNTLSKLIERVRREKGISQKAAKPLIQEEKIQNPSETSSSEEPLDESATIESPKEEANRKAEEIAQQKKENNVSAKAVVDRKEGDTAIVEKAEKEERQTARAKPVVVDSNNDLEVTLRKLEREASLKEEMENQEKVGTSQK